MILKLTNSLSANQKDVFKPINSNKVRIYSCGPTVYDSIHIGNLRSFIMSDLLRRTLVLAGYEVTHVMNLTDVDDKTIKRSLQTYPDMQPKQALAKLTDKYSKLFMKDMDLIGNDTSSLKFISATQSIEGIRALIRELEEDGFAYTSDDGVYFSIQKYIESGKKYGQLVKIDSKNTSLERINNDEYDKDEAHDFALWKTQKEGEPAWPFELSGKRLDGRPGWHIECSVMSTQTLGQPFDIHTGGVDLKFPHHENEIAQSTAGKGRVYANYFIHNEHLLVEGKKMAKSFNNFITLQDISESGVDPLVFRVFTLMSHYRSQNNYTTKSLQQSAKLLNSLKSWADLRFQNLVSKKYAQLLQTTTTDITERLLDDMDTPGALGKLMPAIKQADSLGADSRAIELLVKYLDKNLGFDFLTDTDITAQQKKLINERQTAKQNNDYDLSDKLRDKLEENGITLNDSSQGVTWARLRT
jgi:cysteinyl-tRNA synthetase